MSPKPVPLWISSRWRPLLIFGLNHILKSATNYITRPQSISQTAGVFLVKRSPFMSDYQLEIKQIVDYPRCRVYREFVQSLISDRNIRTNGSSGLFHYTVLCSYANFRTSYRRLDGISYTVYPGEWVCRLSELVECLRLRTRRQ